MLRRWMIGWLFLCVMMFGGCEVSSATKTEQQRLWLEVPPLCQYPALPTGCEATAAAMVLQYYGNAVEAETVAAWLPRSNAFYEQAGMLYGPDPYKVFVGDPFTADSYGCFAPVIAETLTTYTSYTATAVYDSTLERLCEEYIRIGYPVLVWVTMEMRAPADGTAWILPDGTSFVWPAGEHCMVLVGCDEQYFYFNDPRTGGVAMYEKSLCEKRFEQLGRQAVVVC